MASTPSRGRPPSWIVEHITKSTVTNNGVCKHKATCNYCHTVFSYNTQTIAQHLLRRCNSINQSLVAADGDVEPPARKRQRVTSSCNGNSLLNNEDALIPRLTVEQHEQCRRLLALAIITGLVPFEFAENKYIKQLFQILRPDFTPPSADTISSGYLSIFKSETKAKVEQELKEHKSTTLGIDGSKDNNGNPINHILALTPSTACQTGHFRFLN